MTGFGRGETEIEGGRLIVEARSENHRFFDARVQLPESSGFLEPEILSQLKRAVLRGKVKVAVFYDSASSPEPEIDMRAARAALSNLKKLKKNLNLKGEITVKHVLSFGDFITKTRKENAPGSRSAAKIKKAAADALAKLNESRTREGSLLRKELRLRASNCKGIVRKIKSERGRYEKEVKGKLTRRAKSLIGDKNVDEATLYQEVVAIYEKSDITEEIVRMNSHLSRFSGFVSKTGVSVGKELDFLIQEMNRESGTISAKSKSPAISHLAVDLRSEIEKMREQVQNVE